jgi:transcriptional regulator with XRE-family HTH domain
MTPDLCRAARDLLRLRQADLSRLADVSQPTIRAYEKGDPSVRRRTIAALRTALEAEGVEFTEDPEAPGVRLRRPGRERAGFPPGKGGL